nr:hypothetical protein [Clostridia bacterium]
MAQKNKPRSGQTGTSKRPAQKQTNKNTQKANNKKQTPTKKAQQGGQAYKPRQNPQFVPPSFANSNPGQQVPNPMYTHGGNVNYRQQYAQQQAYVNRQYYTQQQPYVNQYTQQQPYANQYTQQQPYANRYTQQQPYANRYTQQQPYANQYTQQQPYANQYTQQQPYAQQNKQKKRPPQSAQAKKPQPKPKPKPPKKKLTPEEIAEQKRLREEAKKRAREEFRKLVDMVVARVMLFLVMFGALFIFCTGCMFLSLFTGNSPDRSPYTLIITQSIAPLDYKPITEEVSYKNAVINGVHYISFSRIAELYNYITTGDEDVVSFLSDIDAAQKVSFHVGSGYYEINGVPCRMASPAYRIDDEIYVPAEFIGDCMTGMTVECSAENRTIKLTRENDSKLDSFITPQFSLHTDAPNTKVAEGSLDDETLLMTDPYRFSIPDVYAGLIQ